MDKKLSELATAIEAYLTPLINESVKRALSELKPEPVPQPEPQPQPDVGIIDPMISPIWHTDFQNVPLTGAEKKEQFKKAFNNAGGVDKVGDWWFEKVNGKTLFRTRIKKGLFGSDLTGVNGWADSFNDPKNPSRGHQELFLRYVFIPRGPKEWGAGSKLPGAVVGGFGNEGGFNSGGTNKAENGGSARLMMKNNLGISPYIYSHDPKGTKWGTDGGAGVISRAVLNEPNEIIMRLVMNTKSNPDGIMQAWHQGKLVCTLTDLIWQLEGNVAKGWDKIAVGSFNGGAGNAFMMKEEALVDFERFDVGYGNNAKVIYKPSDRISIFGRVVGGK